MSMRNTQELLEKFKTNEFKNATEHATLVMAAEMMEDDQHKRPTETAGDAVYWKTHCVYAEAQLASISAILDMIKEAALKDLVEEMARHPFVVNDEED